MHYSITNDNEFRGERVGSALWRGRIHWYGKGGFGSFFHAEWMFFKHAKSGPVCEMELGEGDSGRGVHFHFALPWLFNVFLCFDHLLPRNNRFGAHNAARRIGIHYFERVLTFHVWSRGGMGDWSTRDPWWLHGFRLDIDRILFGCRTYTETNDSGWKETVVPMPEGAYPARIRLFTGEWKGRFGTKRLRRAEIEVEGGIPFPGKGENSWDCGEDATYSLTCLADSEWDAIGKMVSSVLRDRYRNGGGIKWRSTEKVFP